ncbi:Cmx/CmrA family chloramphenicol efflux MFS transporter [Mycobacterium deserti]|uniref:MFS transporter n=1 Tax=Mycobacterium deserti TaxID=2978347 RepID=A0ABT2MJT6_9MYCO|nr:Cmx/CmrA family chloramphenicol efflux MFS transporter [Mycobacterium deserti]MCT7661246.1 MFS transporter [Mycobacterium deserti]
MRFTASKISPVWVIGLAIFAQGTSELMLAGMLPEMSADLSVTIPHAALLISGFAFGMLLGAPTLAIVTLRWPRKRAMLAFLGLFALVHVVGALTTSYPLLLGSRFIGGFVYAGFWAVGASTAMSLVPPDRRGRAMSVVAGGLTVATVVGLPAGTWIGQHFGWRGAFWAVAAMTVAAAVAILIAVPDLRSNTVPRISVELRAVLNRRLWLSYAITATSTASLFGTFSYLGAMVLDTTGLDPAWVPVVMLIYGLGALAGMSAGGRAADRLPVGVLVGGFSALAIVSAALALTATHAVAVVVLVVLLGLVGFGTNPALNSRVFGIAPAAPTLSVAGNIAAFNVGITIGPAVGGMALTAGFGYPAVLWIGAALAVLALGLAGVDATARRTGRTDSSATTRPPVDQMAG